MDIENAKSSEPISNEVFREAAFGTGAMVTYDSTIETLKHIRRVNELLCSVCQLLLVRATHHDLTKLYSPEKELFDKETTNLKNLTYGSQEYKDALERLKPALNHHYFHNSHHPEFYDRGIDDMNLIDLVEMVMDWKAATERHANGSLEGSLEVNRERFGLSEQLYRIIANTFKMFDDLD